MENLFDFELAVRLEIGAAAPAFPDDVSVAVSQITDCLGASGIDAEHVHSLQLTAFG
jgi:hypothetical protein